MSDPERIRILEVASRLGISLEDAQIVQCQLYLDLLERWNRTYNLTSVRQRPDMLVQHLFDCLAIVPSLKEWASTTEPASAPLRCLDVGSGGGLPGVVIAILFPDIEVVCVDAVGKKASFIRQVALETGLKNLAGEHARVEALRAAPFDVVTSRAFASLADFVRLTARHLSTHGKWLAMKGQPPTDEIEALPREIDVFHVEQITVPHLDAARCLIWMQPRV